MFSFHCWMPCPFHLLLQKLMPGLIHLIPVHLQLLLLGSQLTAPQLQLCLLLGWAWGKRMHYLPCPGCCLTYVFPSHEGDLLLLNFGVQNNTTRYMSPQASTFGCGARAGRATIVQTHTDSSTERMEPLTMLYTSRHDSLSAVEKIRLKGYFPPW